MRKRVSVIPEHLIKSDETDGNGYRRLTIRLYPKVKGGRFRFINIEGGVGSHPDLCPGKYWRIVGIVYTKTLKHKVHVDTKELFMKVESYEQLDPKEQKAHMNKSCSYWSDFHANDEELLMKGEQ